MNCSDSVIPDTILGTMTTQVVLNNRTKKKFYFWVQTENSESGGGHTPTFKPLTPEQQPIQELEARGTEKIYIKKTTALLMSDELGTTR